MQRVTEKVFLSLIGRVLADYAPRVIPMNYSEVLGNKDKY